MQERKTGRTANARRKIANASRLVCDCEDLLPFAWRTPPIVESRHPSKVLRELAQAESLRTAPPASKRR